MATFASTTTVLFSLLLAAAAAAAAQISSINLFMNGATEKQFYVPVKTFEFFELSLVTNPDTASIVIDPQGMINGIEVLLNGGSGNSGQEYITVENSQLNSSIHLISQIDYPRYTYRLIGGTTTSYSFFLATLKYVSILDSDALVDPSRNISVSALNSAQENYWTNTAFITPIPDNQESPVFVGGDNTSVQIPENTFGTVATISAIDPDGVSFSLANASTVFDIDTNTGNLSVVNSSTLDYEVEESRLFELVIVATDKYLVPQRRLSASLTVILYLNNTNDERPIFVGTPYVFSVVEEAVGVFVGQVRAEDADGEPGLFFDFESSATGIIFNMNRSTGEITVHSALDFEEQTSYTFNVIVSDQDGIVSTSVTVNVIDITDNRPVISPAEKQIWLSLDNAENEVRIGTEGTGGPLTVTDIDSTLQSGEATITVLRNGLVSAICLFTNSKLCKYTVSLSTVGNVCSLQFV